MKPVDIATIEIFKTNVNAPEAASAIIKRLKITFPFYQFNFDLEDSDKILRVESETDSVNVEKIIFLVKEENIEIEILE